LGDGSDKDGVLNIGVSFDGSWHKREHSFYTGIGVAVDMLTGLPLAQSDLEIMPKN